MALVLVPGALPAALAVWVLELTKRLERKRVSPFVAGMIQFAKPMAVLTLMASMAFCGIMVWILIRPENDPTAPKVVLAAMLGVLLPLIAITFLIGCYMGGRAFLRAQAKLVRRRRMKAERP